MNDWKDNEVKYCQELVGMVQRGRFPIEIQSPETALSYLDVQRVSALRDGREDVAREMTRLTNVLKATTR